MGKGNGNKQHGGKKPTKQESTTQESPYQTNPTLSVVLMTNSKDDHRKASQSPAGSTSSVVTTIGGKPASSSCTRSATSVSASVKSKSEDRDAIMARLEERLKEVTVEPSVESKTKIKVVNTIDYEGLLLRKVTQPTDEKTAAAFKQGSKVKCSKCKETEDSWRNMKNEKVWVEVDNEESEYYWKYTCIDCHAKETGLSREHAIADLKSQRPDNIKRKARIQEFNNARKRVQENFPLMTDKKEVRVFTRSTFVNDVFASFAKIIELKVRHMDRNTELWDEYERLVSIMKLCKSAEESKVLMEKIRDVEEKMEATELPLAFQTVCQPGSETHWRYMQAAQYSDEWVCNKDSKGQVLSAFRSFYICLAGGADYPCYTVIPSKTWSTKHEDPLASKQRWYCICCGACYKTKFGMVIEIEIRGQFYYVKAPIPPENLEDTRAMYLEQTLAPKSPEDLLQKLKDVAPHRNAILSPITMADVYGGGKTKFDPNTFKIKADAYQALQDFDWQQIMNFGKM